MQLQAMQVPSSRPRPTGADGDTYGHTHKIVTWLDETKGAFYVARVIMMAGVNLRAFGPTAKDDPKALSKLWSVLDILLAEEDREDLVRSLREG